MDYSINDVITILKELIHIIPLNGLMINNLMFIFIFYVSHLNEKNDEILFTTAHVDRN